MATQLRGAIEPSVDPTSLTFVFFVVAQDAPDAAAGIRFDCCVKVLAFYR